MSVFPAGTEATWEKDRRLAGELGSDRRAFTCQASEFRLDTIRAGKGWCPPLQRALPCSVGARVDMVHLVY